MTSIPNSTQPSFYGLFYFYYCPIIGRYVVLPELSPLSPPGLSDVGCAAGDDGWAGVTDRVGVGSPVANGDAVTVGIGVPGSAVGVGVLGMAVDVAVAVGSGVFVAVGSGVLVAVDSGVFVAVGSGVLVAVGMGVLVGGAASVGVGVGVNGTSGSTGVRLVPRTIASAQASMIRTRPSQF